jgi:hypothetical protein
MRWRDSVVTTRYSSRSSVTGSTMAATFAGRETAIAVINAISPGCGTALA